MSTIGEKADSIVKDLISKLSSPKSSFAERKGGGKQKKKINKNQLTKKNTQIHQRFLTFLTAAFALAGVIKGIGLAALKKYDIIGNLQTMIQDKHFQSRQGALFAFECLYISLGRLFEPYVIHILPLLLKCFGGSIKRFCFVKVEWK